MKSASASSPSRSLAKIRRWPRALGMMVPGAIRRRRVRGRSEGIGEGHSSGGRGGRDGDRGRAGKGRGSRSSSPPWAGSGRSKARRGQLASEGPAASEQFGPAGGLAVRPELAVELTIPRTSRRRRHFRSVQRPSRTKSNGTSIALAEDPAGGAASSSERSASAVMSLKIPAVGVEAPGTSSWSLSNCWVGESPETARFTTSTRLPRPARPASQPSRSLA